ncbi:MAG: hypothetical protein RL573_85 [Actinomycetota bacterium]
MLCGGARKPLWGLGFVRFHALSVSRNALWTREIVGPVGWRMLIHQ